MRQSISIATEKTDVAHPRLTLRSVEIRWLRPTFRVISLPGWARGGRDLEGDPRTFHAADWPAFGYSAAAVAASGTRFGAGVSRTPTAETIAASTAKPASA
jgi:hypothetical protein